MLLQIGGIMRQLLGLVLCTLFAQSAFAEITGRFTFERLEADVWRAKYCFDEPVDALRFERPVDGMRATHWRPLLPEFELAVEEDGSANITHRDGAAFTCTGLEVDSFTEVPVKNYMAFSKFSDGGMSVYMGYYTGTVFKDGEWQEYKVSASYRGMEGERVITRDPRALDHQFVYFGKQDVVETKDAITVVDPAMPEAARNGIEQSLPEVGRMLSRMFHYTPREPYQVFMAAGELLTTEGSHTKGGTLKNQILFTLKGKKAAEWAIKSTDFYPTLAAHELLHLWQQEVWLDQLGNDAAWMHEGAADALAFELMYRTGAATKEQYEAQWQKAETRCADFIRETSMVRAPDEGKFEVVYRCGALVNRLVGEALSPADPGEGIFQFWQAMAAWDADTIKETRSVELFKKTMEKLGFNNQQIIALGRFTGEQHADGQVSIDVLRKVLKSRVPEAMTATEAPAP